MPMFILCTEASTRCDRCGNPIETSDWYPMEKERDSDGELRLYSFCSDGCKEAWLDESEGVEEGETS
ncbi:YHS domain-containing protein [Halogeometricum pallidum JCM 14848]|uniref:YHS domain-containing protein n=1 Tax=Halogeometricum pallidum JCM 14848 TaxID=1227487 RepID=M0DB70_HALPD|nr:hypothetical protein [Halogeometricum pallidum]ELZ31424.1 YHS domain-containing protein [Halogeometricum pallidum JCM 14848]